MENIHSGGPEFLSKLMTFEEYARQEHPTPYIFELRRGEKNLTYFGAEHTNDITNPMFVSIKKEFIKTQPDIVFVEGVASLEQDKEKIVVWLQNASFTEATKKFGESGFAMKLAVDKGIDIASPEPKFKDEIEELLTKGFSKDEIIAFYTYRDINQYYRNKEEKDLEEYITQHLSLFKESTQWEGFDYSTDHIKEIGKNIWKEKGDITVSHDSYDRIVPTPGESDIWTVVNKAAQQSSYFRDKYMIQKIKESLEKNNKLFILFGASHAYMQEQAIKEIFTK